MNQRGGIIRQPSAGFLSLAMVVCSACGHNPQVAQPVPEEQPVAAPWHDASLGANYVAAVYLQEWRKAPNKQSCAPMAFANVGSAGQGASVRAAHFSGGWGVAYDLPNLRSAFGVAGTGASAAAPSYDDWPHHIRWADGSSVGYGPEGGTGPNQLAYLRVTGQGCLYNVWSRLGVAHLEMLLQSIRFVAVAH